MYILHIVVYLSLYFCVYLCSWEILIINCASITAYWHHNPKPWYPTHHFYPYEDKIAHFPSASWPGRLFQSAEDTVSRQHTRGAAGFSPAIRQPLCVWGPVWLWAQLQHLLPQQEGPAAALAAVSERWACWQTGEKAENAWMLNSRGVNRDFLLTNNIFIFGGNLSKAEIFM